MSDQTQMRDSHLTLRERIDAAIERITHGQAAMRIPVEATDPDMVLAECSAMLDRLDAAERERDHHSRWRVDLADKLHDAESQISAAWAALRRAGIQSEETVAEAIALLHAENERLREDAERYRWLRGRAEGHYMTVCASRTDIDEVCLGDALDAAIDAARAAEPNDRRDK